MHLHVFKLLSAYIQLMEAEAPPHGSTLNVLIKNRLKILILFILNYHIVQNDATQYDIVDSIQLLLPAGVLHSLPPGLEDSKCPLHILAGP
jgi:hypothetical protein